MPAAIILRKNSPLYKRLNFAATSSTDSKLTNNWYFHFTIAKILLLFFIFFSVNVFEIWKPHSRRGYLQQNVRKIDSNYYIADKCREHFFPTYVANPDIKYDSLSLRELSGLFVFIVAFYSNNGKQIFLKYPYCF